MTETTQDGADVVERLRALSNLEHDDLSIGDEAADLLERLSSEIERLRAERNEALAAARALRQFVSPPLTQSDMDAAIEIARAIRPDIDAELAEERKATPAIPDGWVLVPREPDADMAEVARDWAQRDWNAFGDPKGYLKFYQGIYRAMINAVPKPEGE